MKVRKHGYSKRRTWRKLHIGVDEATQEIVAALVTTNDWADGEILPDLLSQVEEEIAQVSGDGAYDTRDCYEAVRTRGAAAAIPPRRGAKIWEHGNRTGEPHPRDENLRAIRKRGRRQWKKSQCLRRIAWIVALAVKPASALTMTCVAQAGGSNSRSIFLNTMLAWPFLVNDLPNFFPGCDRLKFPAS